MTETVDTTTGEIVAVDPSSEIAVTSYLQQAVDLLAQAVASTDPATVAMVKAQIATAAEATKQLGLSKENQEYATEMVRRSEFSLRIATKRAQAAGEVVSNGGDRRSDLSMGKSERPSPASYFGSHKEYVDANAMADLSSEEFDEVLAEARTEGNLSRANVAAKAKERRQPKRPRPAAEVSLNTISSLADRAARETQKLTADQIRRVKPNAAEWVGGIRDSIEVLQDLVNSLEEN